jgi:hypothetical protein
MRMVAACRKGGVVEFLNFVLMFVAAWLIWRKPERERLAFRLLVIGVVFMMAVFSLATRTAFLPGVNY